MTSVYMNVLTYVRTPCNDSRMNTNTATALATAATATEMRETLRQMLADWNAATEAEREAALAAVAA